MMKTVRLVEGMDYPEEIPEPQAEHHTLLIEIFCRLQELDEHTACEERPLGIRALHKLSRIEARSTRAYRLILDVVGRQRSFKDSLAKLGARHQNARGEPTSRQAWLQQAHQDIAIIKSAWPEVGDVMESLLRRQRESRED